MNLRWLLGNFTDPRYQLTRQEQFRLSRLAHERHLPRFAFILRTAVIVAPLLGLLALLHPALKALGRAGEDAPFTIGVAAIVLLSWPWSAWMYRSLYAKPVRRAMREAGYDLCIECGYELRGLDASITRCPECGSDRERLPRAGDDA